MQKRREQIAGWLRQGMTPRRLALTLSLGFAIGCLPMVGLPTALCAILALAFGLNQPAIQAANYAALPLQLLLIGPFVRLGRWMISADPIHGDLLHTPFTRLLTESGTLAGQAFLAWFFVAAPAVLLLTFALTPVLRRVPAIAQTAE
ncbi:MAG TPA: DUF2062 domain-containing protein [Terracidiphilus sp.]|nr:DUF2062 domain-containing protein [Terracidiphilus sp.]